MRPSIESSEYQELMMQRQYHKIFGNNYEGMMWAQNELARLEEKSVRGMLEYSDYFTLDKIRTIADRIQKKAEETRDSHTTTHYIWRTQGDGKTRPSHAANADKIFSWDSPPETGNPGEDYNCRCWAEPYVEDSGGLQERVSQTVTNMAEDASSVWMKGDFIKHYFLGHGSPATLHEIGHLQDIVTASETMIFKKVADQICTEARQRGVGAFQYHTVNAYEFRNIIYSIGGATVRSDSQIQVEEDDEKLIVTAEIEYNFHDIFTDVFSINEILEWLGEQDAIQLTGLMLGIGVFGVNTALELFEKIKKEMNLPDETNPNDIGEWDLPGATAFEITDTWSTKLEATIKK